MMKLLLALGACATMVVVGIVFAVTSRHARIFQVTPASAPASVSIQPPPANSPDPLDAGGSAAPDSSPPAAAETTSPSDSGSSGWTPGSNGGEHGRHGQGMQRLFAELDLTGAQKQQIAQIRQAVTDRRERREQIMAVLTPDQQARFEQLRAQFRGHHGQGQDQQGQPGMASPLQTASPAPPPIPAPTSTSAPVSSST